MKNAVQILSIPYTDHDHITWLRHQVAYNGYRNSLVEWTMSDEWTIPNTGLSYIRGSRNGALLGMPDNPGCECNGEISGH